VISEDQMTGTTRPQQDLRLPGRPADAGDRVFAQDDAEAGDVLVLCTDGVWSVLPANMLAAALKTADLMRRYRCCLIRPKPAAARMPTTCR
jgi:hypothetical protein